MSGPTPDLPVTSHPMIQHLMGFINAAVPPEQMSPQMVAALFDFEPILTDWFKSVRRVVEARVAAKKMEVPGWGIGAGKRHREWLSEADAVTAMSAAGINDPYSRELLSVAAAEEKIPEANKPLLAAAWRWVPGKPGLRRVETIEHQAATRPPVVTPEPPQSAPTPTPSSTYGW